MTLEQRPGFEPSPSPWKGELSPRTNTANIYGAPVGIRTRKSPASKAGRCTSFHKPPGQFKGNLAGGEGIEPSQCLDQNQMPSHLANPQQI